MRKNAALLVASAVLVIILLICGIIAVQLPGQSIMISEVRSDWGDVLYAADGSGHGFIELYNNSAQAVSLDGWYLSDSTLNRDKYRITDCTIAPYSYAVFWTNEAADVVGLPVSGYFLGFALQEHEPVVLSDPNGKIVDTTTIPTLQKGYSYSQGVTGMWGVRVSSPGAESASGIELSTPSVASPVISLPSGFYEGSIRVEISSAPGNTVYYTLDGSPPDVNALQYNGPLLLSDPTQQENRYSMLKNISTFSLWETYAPSYPIPKIQVLRAIAVDANGNTSEEVYASYFIDYEDRYGFEDVMILSIITDPDNFFSDDIGIYVLGNLWSGTPDTSDVFWIYSAQTNYSASGKGWRRPVQLELFDADHHLVSDQSASISIHGNWSVVHSQKSFNVYAFSSTEDDTVIFPGVHDSDSASIMLCAGGFRDLYSTKIRDVLNQSLVADRAITVQDAIPCQVFLNGEYWGLYNLQERIDEGLIASTYHVNPNNLVILKNYTPVAGEPEDANLFQEVLDFVAANDLSDDANYAKVCQMIDIQSYIDYYCFQIYVANCDSVSNNYAMWRTRYAVDDKYGDGRWRWILYDTDDSLGMVEGLTEPEVDSFSQGHWTNAPLDDLLFTSLIKNQGFKLQFAQTFEEMAVNNFSPDAVNEKIDELCQIYMPATVVSQHRFTSAEFTEQDYLKEIQVIKDFFSSRYEHIRKYMLEHLGL